MLVRIQLLRAVAAYMVVVFHAVEFLVGSTSLPIPRAAIGAAGVDIFFVISGFIMVHVTREGETPAGFALNRISRIVPLYWLGTLAVVLAVLVAPWSFPNALTDPASILKSLAFIPSIDARGSFEPILFVGWTLNFEMAFYAVFALSLFAPRRYRTIALVAGLVALFAAGRLIAQTNPMSFYGNAILFEFAAGCFIGAAVRNPALKPAFGRVPAVLVVALGAAGFLASALLPESPLPRALLWGVPATLIVLGAVLLDIRKPASSRTLAAHLGDASYSAYLLHPFVVVAVGVITLKLLGQGWMAAVAMVAATLLATAVVSGLSFRLVERPSAQLLRRLFGIRPHRVDAVAASSASSS
jgi:exopolysaccharide production protein ExoZ